MVVRNDNVLLGNVELRMFQKIFAYRLGKIGEHVTRGPKCAGGFGKADCLNIGPNVTAMYFTLLIYSPPYLSAQNGTKPKILRRENISTG